MRHEVITASAGSGKTYRLSNRIITMLLDGAEPRKVIALTFTRMAAGEFAGALFAKLAEAAASQEQAEQLSTDLGRKGRHRREDFLWVLASVVKELPDLYLGTLDSFFTRIVQAFQLELGLSSGSGVQILEGPELEELRTEIINEILTSDQISPDNQRDLLQDFKQANYGKEKVSVLQTFLQFLKDWHMLYLSRANHFQWGDLSAITEGEVLEDWSENKQGLIADFKAVFAEMQISDKAHLKAVEKCAQCMEEFVGAGSQGFNTLFNRLAESAEDLKKGNPVTVKSGRVEVEISAEQSRRLGRVIVTLAGEELRVHAERTSAVYKVVQLYEAVYELRARSVGKLAFDDLKLILSKWQSSEKSRLQREAIDYRLDATYDHWLLDEFQDTSKDQWTSLEPLLDEVGQDHSGARSLFVVGDTKQSIYQWRGGDPKLFLDVAERYSITPEGMADSWRSQKPVLDLVNSVFGNEALMRSMFGAAVDKWHWDEHRKAPLLTEKPAYSEVYECAPEEKEAYLIQKIKDVNPMGKGLSCAVLLRKRVDVKKYVDLLRANGVDAAEEGKIKPALDNPLGALMLDWMRWLVNPNNSFARVHILMSPLADFFPQLGAEGAPALWSEWNDQVSNQGLVATIVSVFSSLDGRLSPFSKDRREKILECLRGAQGDLESIVRQLEKLEVKVANDSNVVQVMTIHNSKGLGFDVVFVPEISNTSMINSGNYSPVHVENDHGNSLISRPKSWVYPVFPQINENFSEWKEEQYYGEFCALYVAFTRAKRGLYCLLDEPKNSKKTRSSDSLGEWIVASLPDDRDGGEGVLYANGNADWAGEIEATSAEPTSESRLVIEMPCKRGRSSGGGKGFRRTAFSDQSALKRGTEVHDLMEIVDWLPPAPEPLPEDFTTELLALDDGGRYLENLIKEEVRSLMVKPAGDVVLYREQSIEWIGEDGHWNTVRLDRFVVHYIDGVAMKIQLIDFKTDRSGNLEEKYRDQLQRYEEGLRAVFGDILVESHLVSLGM